MTCYCALLPGASGVFKARRMPFHDGRCLTPASGTNIADEEHDTRGSSKGAFALCETPRKPRIFGVFPSAAGSALRAGDIPGWRRSLSRCLLGSTTASRVAISLREAAPDGTWLDTKIEGCDAATP